MITSKWAARLAALGTAFAMWAAPASADIVRYDAAGFFYDVTGPAGWYGAPLPGCAGGPGPCIDHHSGRDHVDFNGTSTAPYPTFALSFTIDTDRGDLTQGPDLATFDWAAGDGPNPLLSGFLDLAIPDVLIDLSAVTSISLRNQLGPFSDTYSITLVGSEFSLAIYKVDDIAPINLTQNQTFTGYPLGPASKISTASYDVQFSNTRTFSITNLGPSPGPIPEPITWGLMLIGLGSVGAALRRERREHFGVEGKTA